jgi:hypothetical protein
MSVLTLFGLVAVTLMLVFYALERRSYWFVLAFSAPASWGRCMAFCKGLGHSAWWKLSGLVSHCTAGGSNGGLRDDRRSRRIASSVPPPSRPRLRPLPRMCR